MLEVGGDVVLESLRTVTDASGAPVLEARFVNYRGAAQPLAARADGVWDRTDLTGTALETDVDLASFEIGAARIETFRRRSA